MLRSKLRGSLRCQIVVFAGCGALRVNFLGIRKLASASKAPNKQRVKANKMPSFEMRASEWGFCFIGMLFTRVLSQIRREVMRKNRDPLEIFWRVSPEACRNIKMFTFRRRQLAVPLCSAQSQRSPSAPLPSAFRSALPDVRCARPAALVSPPAGLPCDVASGTR